jgi:glycosyltransferase involved in cell wall biosynthesis
MRILYLEPSGLVTGGAVALLRLIAALDRRVYSPLVVLGSDGPLADEFRRSPGCRVLCRPLPPGLATTSRFDVLSRRALVSVAGALRYALMLRRVAHRWRPDIVHSNGLKTHALAALACPRGARLVWHMRDFISTPYMPARPAKLIRSLARVLPDAVVCNSETTRASMANAFRGAAACRLHVVPDGIDAVRFTSTASPVQVGPQAAARVLLLGRIAEWKGQHVFIEAARRLVRRHRDVLFLIAGGATTAADARYTRELQRLVECDRLGDRIVFTGMVRDPASLLWGADILVHCSTSPEPFGQVIVEAMAASVPVIATRLGAPTAIIEDGVNGRLVPPGDAAALARALDDLLGDAAARRRLAAAGLTRVRESYGIERTVRSLTALYRARAAATPPAQASAT